MKKATLLILLLFILIGCSQQQLSTPENLRFTDQIYFDEVENATDYILNINGEEIKIAQTSYQITSEGTFLVKVKSTAKGYKDSPYSETIEIVIDYTLVTPSNLSISNNTLTWDVIEGASSYEVLLNQTIIPVTTNTLSLEPYLPDVLIIKVKAVYPSGSSTYSEQLIYTEDAEILGELKYKFSTNSTFDLTIFETSKFITMYNDNNQIMQSNVYTYTNQEVKFLNTYLKALDTGLHEYKVLTEDGFYIVEIDVTNATNPYMINNNQIYSSFEDDITLQFELFGGTIQNVSGNNIESSDYTINQSQLVISIDYVQNIFENEPERTTLILSYTLQYNQDIIIGYIFIRKAE
jgi:hypothetical protein